MNSEASSKSVLIGSLLLLSAEASFAGVSALLKHLSATQNFEQLVFFRNVLAFLVLLPWLWRKGPAALTTKRWKLHVVRGIAGITAMFTSLFVGRKMILWLERQQIGEQVRTRKMVLLK